MEKYLISIENRDSDSQKRKEFNCLVMMNDRQYVAFVSNLLKFLDDETIKEPPYEK